MGDSIAESQMWAMAGSGAGFVLHVIFSLVWLGVVVGVVWKHRRDAAGMLLLGASISLVLACVAPFASSALSFYVSRTLGVQALVRVNAIAGLALSAIALIPQALLIAGVAQLARPARRDVRDPDVRTLDR